MFNHNHPHHRNRFGFTLAEMTIVIMIMGILFGISSTIYSGQRNVFVFNSALTRTLQMIRTVRTYATSTTPVAVPEIGNVIPVDGYGIDFKLDATGKNFTITVFANLAENPKEPHVADDPKINQFNEGQDVVIESYTLPSQIKFNKFYFQTPDDLKATPPAFPAKYISSGDEKGPTAYEAIAFFRPPMADSWLVGFEKNSEVAIPLANMRIELQNPETAALGSKRCQWITLNSVKTFPELSYNSCQ